MLLYRFSWRGPVFRVVKARCSAGPGVGRPAARTQRGMEEWLWGQRRTGEGPELVAREIKEKPGWADAQEIRRQPGCGLLAYLDSVGTGQGRARGQPCPSAITGTHRGPQHPRRPAEAAERAGASPPAAAAGFSPEPGVFTMRCFRRIAPRQNNHPAVAGPASRGHAQRQLRGVNGRSTVCTRGGSSGKARAKHARRSQFKELAVTNEGYGGNLFAIAKHFHKRLRGVSNRSALTTRGTGTVPGLRAPLSPEDPLVCFLLLQNSHFLRRERTHECIR